MNDTMEATILPVATDALAAGPVAQVDTTTPTYWPYALILVPFASRLLMVFQFLPSMKKLLTPEQRELEIHRTYILAMMGFSFTALLMVVLVDASAAQRFRVTSLYLLLSFLCYLAALGIQDYKDTRLLDQVGMTLISTAVIALLLSTLSALEVRSGRDPMWWVAYTLVALVWISDYAIRYTLEWKFLRDSKEVR